jgi:hypothetical protein
MVVHTFHTSYIRKHKIGWWTRPVWAKIKTLFPKTTKTKRDEGMAQVAEHLLS